MRSNIAQTLQTAAQVAQQPTDGQWLEGATVLNGPEILEWDLAECYLWADWPGRKTRFPGTTAQDVGIDAVGVRRDGGFIAIQCKSRQLDEHGVGADRQA